jgi:hypothetical protein
VSRSARLVVRVVFVPGAGVADARRRVADVLLCAANAGAEAPDAATTPAHANEPPMPPREKAA